MPTSIFFNGRLISIPGSYSVVDASGLEQVGLGAVGIVAVLGTGEGGKPANEISELKDFIVITKPEQGQSIFRSGDLREVIPMLFAPAKDPSILGGAVQVVVMKVNPATRSSATLSNGSGNCMLVESADYGAFTGQVNLSIADGTVQGKKVTIIFEDTTEAGDDIGGDHLFNLKYTNPGNGWTTMTGQVKASGIIECMATRTAMTGKDGDITDSAGDHTVTVVSGAAGDTTQQVVVYGLDVSNNPQQETLNLNGTTPVVGTKVFKTASVWGGKIIGTTAGAVVVSETTGATIMTITAGSGTSKGLYLGQCMYGAGAVTLVADGATTKIALVVGTSATGAAQMEKFTLTGAVPVVGTAVWSEITAIVLGDVEVARAITASGKAATTSATVQTTLQKCADYFNARYIATVGGYTFTLNTGMTTFDPADLDVMTSSVSILSPADPGFHADLWAVIDWINDNSQYAVASAIAGAKDGAPSNTSAPVFLSGGSEGTTLATHWQAALNLLKKAYVNSVVVLTGDPAIHAALDAHCAYMCGIGRMERDGFAGAMNAGLDDVPSKTEFKTQAVDLNSRHVRLCGQAIERYNVAGERTEFMPPFQAAVLAGMQSGGPVGQSLTHKYANVLSLRQDTSWNPTDDAEEMIQGGCCFMEAMEGIGRRVVRNITTYLVDDNIAYCEGSVNQAVNFAVYSFRTNMEWAVGKQGFAGTINACKGLAIGTLGLLVDEGILVAYQSLDIELIVDVLEVSIQIAPIIPINFVKNTIHLVTIAQSAA